MGKIKPRRGFVVVVPHLPICDFCGVTARYDFKTRSGPWAYGCDAHWKEHGSGLGEGIGQMLIVPEEAEEEVRNT
jgi:hypothetical protein